MQSAPAQFPFPFRALAVLAPLAMDRSSEPRLAAWGANSSPAEADTHRHCKVLTGFPFNGWANCVLDAAVEWLIAAATVRDTRVLVLLLGDILCRLAAAENGSGNMPGMMTMRAHHHCKKHVLPFMNLYHT